MSSLVVISLEPWDDVWRRNQHLVSGLLRTDPQLQVLFVEPATDPSHQALTLHRPRRGHGLRRAPVVPGVAEGQLHLFQPTKWLPRRIHSAADKRLARAVVRAVEALGFVKPVLWVNDPTGAKVAEITAWPTLYDITDDWLEADRTAAENTRLRLNEEFLLKYAQEVVVCSPDLQARKGGPERTTLVPNAVDLRAYRDPHPRPSDMPNGKVALYMGTLHTDRLDLELCIETSNQLPPDSALVMLGPNALTPTATAALNAAGVLILGSRPHAAIPAYLQNSDVLVVPHLINSFTDSLDPIKAYEYLASGRPVCSTPVAGFRDMKLNQITISEQEQFPNAVSSALTGGITVQNSDIIIPDWSARVGQMRALLDRIESR